MNNHLKTFTPPPEIDAIIKEAARREITARKLRRLRRKVFATAAVACLGVGVFFYALDREAEKTALQNEYLAHWDTNSLENDVYALNLTLDGSRSMLVGLE